MNLLCRTRHAIAGIVLSCTAAGLVRAGEMHNAGGVPERGTHGGAPGVDLKQVVTWGSMCEQQEGEGLAFGGQDQRASDGRPHTRVPGDRDWVRIDEELRKRNPLQGHRNALWALRNELKNALGRSRYRYFEGKTEKEVLALLKKQVNPTLERIAEDLAEQIKALETRGGLDDYERGQVVFALERIQAAQPSVVPLEGVTQPKILGDLRRAQIRLELTAESLGAEPPPRACRKIVYDSTRDIHILPNANGWCL